MPTSNHISSHHELIEPHASALGPRHELVLRFKRVRTTTESLCKHLSTDDHMCQVHEDTSPLKWHLGHTTWFFERFILEALKNNSPHNTAFNSIFNSYYVSQGTPFIRKMRGSLSRPTLREIHQYRALITEQILELLEHSTLDEETLHRLEVGIHHEEQHQELMLMDIKFNFFHNPLAPAYTVDDIAIANMRTELTWGEFEGGLTTVGHDGPGFSFDHERPAHKNFLEPFKLASRLVTNSEWMDFINDGGYNNSKLWLSDGWDHIKKAAVQSPLYWQKRDNQWFRFCLRGWVPCEEHAPVCHISYYEADAYANWCNKRLPTEFEWEYASTQQELTGNFLETNTLSPQSSTEFFGNTWCHTQSAFSAYPGYKPFENALGEYNGKFMINQTVLRGGSCFTPKDHVRRTYRNFFYPHQRWAMQGLRLADTLQLKTIPSPTRKS